MLFRSYDACKWVFGRGQPKKFTTYRFDVPQANLFAIVSFCAKYGHSEDYVTHDEQVNLCCFFLPIKMVRVYNG